MNNDVRLLGICGSLRSGSYNHGLLRALADDAPAGVTLDLLDDWSAVPNLNVDLLDDGRPPAVVQDIVDRVRAADGLVIAAPEYCNSVPGAFKNLLDWLSFPPPANCLRFKPIGLVGASIGPGGTLRGQSALRGALLFFDSIVMGRPEVAVGLGKMKFDDAGCLKDEEVRALLRRFLSDFVEFTQSTRARGLDPREREFVF
ncbi:NADPH-dependent FMN reductase [Amycolatopsis rhabdoformis]|uniref:NADPH-dependent FMN reductase n=1 Tax=Amycolatopsis rhabdoformis TaxID=1448059 RepID=A0ABZ1IJ25_9PSEU|nr:NADPH-dependent FMN reductase [Amycolatopsis rhabdoformis]WSE34164.1 NADPH-dependent FMN reductase [Amycolatopsis rhabdoformis]